MKLKKTFNKSVLLALALMLTMLFAFDGLQAQAETTLSDYTPYTLGSSESGMITENGPDRQYYRFALPSSGQIQITGNARVEYMYLYLYDENAKELWGRNMHWNSTSEVISVSESFYLTSGVYYFCVRRDGRRYGDFNFKIDFTSSNESFAETNGGSNNTITQASEIMADGTTYQGQIANNDDKDFYRFTLRESGKVDLNATFYGIEWVYLKLYNEDGEEIQSLNPKWNATTENIVVSQALHLTAGSYSLAISKDGSRYGKYTFSLPFTAANETYPEKNGGSNNAVTEASAMTLGASYNGQLAVNDEKDFYQFTLPSSRSLSIHIDADMEYVDLKLYDASGNEQWSQRPYWNSITKKISYTRTSILEKGSYYIAVVRYGSRCGNYKLTVAELTKNNCPHDYNSEWHDATYFSKGYRQYLCKLCGHTYRGEYTAARKLPQGYLNSYYSSAGKGSLELSWSYASDASGYQIRYSTNKTMKSGVVTKKAANASTTSKTIKGLSRRKNYYVQVRPYKTQGSKTVYGQWSAKLKLKTK